MALDIFHFINSRDIRAHLQKINYQFTALEAAYLVYYNYTATLFEKLAAWQEIIDTMPDCSVEERLNLPYISSIHDFLRRCIYAAESELEGFYRDGDCYSYSEHTPPIGSEDAVWSESPLFADYKTCINRFEQDGFRGDTDFICIRRNTFYRGGNSFFWDGKGELFMNRLGDILLPPDRNVAGFSITSYFCNMWFDFPTPFRCGDIVHSIDPYAYDRPGGPCVLYYLSTWDRSELLSRGFPSNDSWLQYADKAVASARKSGDCSEMQAYGCGYDAGGQVWIGDYGFAQYLDLEYVTEPLTGKDRLLYSLSSFVKGEIDAEVLLNTSNIIRIEEEYKRQMRQLCYKDDILRAAGLDRSFDRQ